MGIGEVGELLRRFTVHIRGISPQHQSAGSGVILDSEGTIVTNAHVVDKGTHWVELWDGRSLRADIKARDDHRDLATLKLHASGLPAATFRNYPVKPGELVVAVGNPMGFTGALTTGVIHGTGPFPPLGRRPWIQAAIRLAPGNSGGPLADAEGQIVGINTMIASSGVALAIPGVIVGEFVKNGARPQLGVTVRPVRIRRNSVGLLILGVEHGSPAEQSSLLIGDLLTGTDQAPFNAVADLADAIAESSIHLKLRFLRGSRATEREVAISFDRTSTREAA